MSSTTRRSTTAWQRRPRIGSRCPFPRPKSTRSAGCTAPRTVSSSRASAARCTTSSPTSARAAPRSAVGAESSSQSTIASRSLYPRGAATGSSRLKTTPARSTCRRAASTRPTRPTPTRSILCLASGGRCLTASRPSCRPKTWRPPPWPYTGPSWPLRYRAGACSSWAPRGRWVVRFWRPSAPPTASAPFVLLPCRAPSILTWNRRRSTRNSPPSSCRWYTLLWCASAPVSRGSTAANGSPSRPTR
mmetsp:Transcript_21267/g.68725  ORF Transcript_21267/g.68725 Transcript_21267/m.68725 type:complete len:246 (+) Transcript_21267:133-870(+)